MPDCVYPPESEDYYDFILTYSSRNEGTAYALARTHCVNFLNREYAVAYLPRRDIRVLSVSPQYYAAIPKLYGLLDTVALESSGIPAILDQPTLRATGRGVLLGIIDTGINYADPLFCHPDGTTRIRGIWDQTLVTGQMPEPVIGFQPFYGATFNEAEINAALASGDPYGFLPSQDTHGHGTFMAAIAAGSRGPRPAGESAFPPDFHGAAPEASLAIVKLKPAKQNLRDFYLIHPDADAFQENDIMAGISYLTGLANEFQMPLVVCLGLGTNQGSHSGTSPLCNLIQSFETSVGIAFSVAAGNEVGLQHHYMGTIRPDQIYDDVEIRVGPEERGFCLELWANSSELYTVGFVSPTGEVVERIGIRVESGITIPFRFDGTAVTVDFLDNESSSGNQLIFMRFDRPSEGIWHIRVYPTVILSGEFHMWLPMGGFITDKTIFLRPDPNTTITDPGNTEMPVTVSTYNHASNSIYIHSSRGYTRRGQIKPDLAAPGVDVAGRTGSSIAAAITAGAIADIFTWGITDNHVLTMGSASVKTMLIRGAQRNPALAYPNREWGYGTLDLYGAFNTLR